MTKMRMNESVRMEASVIQLMLLLLPEAVCHRERCPAKPRKTSFACVDFSVLLMHDMQVVPNNFNVKPIPQEIFTEHLIYAKRRTHPRMKSVDQEKIAQVYAELRRQSLVTGSVPVTVGQIESMLRIAEWHNRMYLRGFVNDDNINFAI